MIWKDFIGADIKVGQWAWHRPPLGVYPRRGLAPPILTKFGTWHYADIPMIWCENGRNGSQPRLLSIWLILPLYRVQIKRRSVFMICPDTEYVNLSAYGWLSTENIGQYVRHIIKIRRMSLPDMNISSCQKWIKIETFSWPHIPNLLLADFMSHLSVRVCDYVTLSRLCRPIYVCMWYLNVVIKERRSDVEGKSVDLDGRCIMNIQTLHTSSLHMPFTWFTNFRFPLHSIYRSTFNLIYQH